MKFIIYPVVKMDTSDTRKIRQLKRERLMLAVTCALLAAMLCYATCMVERFRQSMYQKVNQILTEGLGDRL